MAHVCSDQDRLFYEKKALLDLHMPQRKLLQHRNLSIYLPEEITRNQDADGRHDIDDNEDEPEEEDEEKATDEEMNVYSSDEFRMYEFKVRRCMRGRSHDWTDCPFAHPGEKARRRDPRRHHYSGAVCPDFRRTGCCPRGDACELAHGVFECWLHPARYRTMPCKDGRRCRRKVCFFAHSPRQLRVLPSHTNSPSSPPPSPRMKNQPQSYDALWSAAAKASVLSPTSPLVNFSSPPASPPISPSVADQYQLSCLGSRRRNTFSSYSYKEPENMFPAYGVMGYDALYEELINSLDAMEIAASSTSSPLPSPATTSSSSLRANEYRELALMEQSSSNNNNGNGGGPDLEWVNELLM